VLVPQSGSAGLIGRFHAVSPGHGTYNGYTFDVTTDGTFTLVLNKGGTAAETRSGGQQIKPASTTMLRSGALKNGKASFAAGTWHTLSLSISGASISASIDGRQVTSLTDSTLADGIPGIEVGGWYPAYFASLTVTQP
jgi:hypothetical protein